MAIFSMKTGTYSRSMLAGNPYYIPPGFESIATVTATGGETSLTFTSIPQNYVALQIRGISRETVDASGTAQVRVSFNGDNGSNYQFHRLYGDGSAVTAYGSANYVWPLAGVSTAGQTIANAFGASIIDIHDYASTSQYKTYRAFGGGDNNMSSIDYWLALFSGSWRNTAAITSITMIPLSSWAAGTRFALYGIKGAA